MLYPDIKYLLLYTRTDSEKRMKLLHRTESMKCFLNPEDRLIHHSKRPDTILHPTHRLCR